MSDPDLSFTNQPPPPVKPETWAIERHRAAGHPGNDGPWPRDRVSEITGPLEDARAWISTAGAGAFEGHDLVQIVRRSGRPAPGSPTAFVREDGRFVWVRANVVSDWLRVTTGDSADGPGALRALVALGVDRERVEEVATELIRRAILLLTNFENGHVDDARRALGEGHPDAAALAAARAVFHARVWGEDDRKEPREQGRIVGEIVPLGELLDAGCDSGAALALP